jgi:hypothetical protein
MKVRSAPFSAGKAMAAKAVGGDHALCGITQAARFPDSGAEAGSANAASATSVACCAADNFACSALSSETPSLSVTEVRWW